MDAARILIVEDESLSAMNISMMLEERDYEVTGITPSGKGAIECARIQKPDLVLMDIILNDSIDGIMACQEIKACQDIPVIFMTAHSDKNTLNRAKTARPDGYIVKPLNSDELYSTIEIALYKHRMEVRLQDNELLYKSLLQVLEHGVLLINTDGIIVQANPCGQELLGYGGRNIQGRYFPDLRINLLKQDGSSMSSGKIAELLGNSGKLQFKDIVLGINGAENSVSWITLNVYQVYNSRGDREMSVWTLNDITKLRQAEDKLKHSRHIEELLLAEIHHRVKNNFQVINSLVSLQSEYIKDERDRSLYVDTRNRIFSMALVHEKLYQSDDLARIDFSIFIQELIEELRGVYPGANDSIAVSVQAEQIYLGINQAIPCALLINEIVSNALKHAFPENRLGTIVIELFEDAEECYLLQIKDDGVGLPGELDFRNPNSLGLQLVQDLVGQLKGEVELYKSNGTRFSIIFPVQ